MSRWDLGIDSEVVQLLPGTDDVEMTAGRVSIRCFTRADLDQRALWPRYDEIVLTHLNLHLETPRSRDLWYDREWQTRKPFWFAVRDEHGELIGSITLREVSRWRRSARFGVHLHPKRLGQGYGTEALRLFIDYYFNRLRFSVLKLDVAAFNTRAIRCYEKLGFRHQFEFWRPNTSGVAWLKDDRFAHLRDAVVERRGVEQVKHYEMHLDLKAYRQMQGQMP